MFHGDNNWWGMPMMWIIWLPIIVIAVLVVVKYSNNSPTVSKGESPLDILRKRYAKGEITKEEYEEMKKTL